jgi:hypothetical protein
MLKSINEISKIHKVHYDTILRIKQSLNLIPIDKKNKIGYYNKFQQNLIAEKLLNNKNINQYEGLRTINEIAAITGTNKQTILNIIAKENIVPITSKPHRLNDDQQTIIFMVLHYESRCEFITLPSKMNNPDFDIPPIYSRLDFIKNGNIIAKK